MELRSDSFADQHPIPESFAFGKMDPDTHVALSDFFFENSCAKHLGGLRGGMTSVVRAFRPAPTSKIIKERWKKERVVLSSTPMGRRPSKFVWFLLAGAPKTVYSKSGPLKCCILLKFDPFHFFFAC